MDEAILREIDKALDVDDLEQKAKLFDAIIERLRNLDDKSAQDEAAYLIGYLYYLHPRKGESSEIRSGVARNLLQSLKITSEPSIAARAALYLGHHAYDGGDYHSAAKWFRKLEPEQLPDYLLLKALEMRLCCTIRTEGLAASLVSMDAFVRHAESLPIEDVWPEELARTLKETPQNLEPFEASRFQRLAKHLDDIGKFGSWFSDIIKPGDSH